MQHYGLGWAPSQEGSVGWQSEGQNWPKEARFELNKSQVIQYAPVSDLWGSTEARPHDSGEILVKYSFTSTVRPTVHTNPEKLS